MNEGAITTLLSLLTASRAEAVRRHKGLTGRQMVRATVGTHGQRAPRAGGRVYSANGSRAIERRRRQLARGTLRPNRVREGETP